MLAQQGFNNLSSVSLSGSERLKIVSSAERLAVKGHLRLSASPTSHSSGRNQREVKARRSRRFSLINYLNTRGCCIFKIFANI